MEVVSVLRTGAPQPGTFRYGPLHALGDILMLAAPMLILSLALTRRALLSLPPWWDEVWVVAWGLFLLYRARIKVTWLPRQAELGKTLSLTLITAVPLVLLVVISARLRGATITEAPHLTDWLQSLVWVPLWEELFFRGYIHTRLLRHDGFQWRLGRFSLSRAALVSGTLFGAVHIANYLSGGPLDPIPVALHLGFAAIFGMVAAEFMSKTGALLGPILLHAAVNGGFGLYFLWMLARG